MFDLKAAREEMARIHSEATSHVEKFSADTQPTDEETKAQDARFARLEKLAAQIADNEKLAKFAFSKEQPVAAKVIVDVRHPDHSAAVAAPKMDDSREGYAKALTSFVREGEVGDEYATITTSANSVLVPTVVAKPLTPTKLNPFRKAMVALGFAVDSFGNTAPVNTPVITANSGAVVTEGATGNTDANPTIGNIALVPAAYQSGTAWFSNQVINGLTYDVTASTLPALQAARDYGFGKVIFAAIKADSGVTQSTTTASTSTLTLANVDSLNQLLPIPYDGNKAIILNQDAYNLAEKLTDTTGQPIMQRNDIQGMHFLSFKGTPVFKTDALDVMGTSGHVVGIVVSFDGFKLRDELEKLIRYVDNPNYVDQTGINDVAYHAFGYVPAAIGKLVN